MTPHPPERTNLFKKVEHAGPFPAGSPKEPAGNQPTLTPADKRKVSEGTTPDEGPAVLPGLSVWKDLQLLQAIQQEQQQDHPQIEMQEVAQLPGGDEGKQAAAAEPGRGAGQGQRQGNEAALEPGVDGQIQ